MPDDLTTSQAADELGIQANSVKRLCQRKVLDAEKRGRDWFISRAEVERYKKEPRKRGPKKTIHKSITNEGDASKQ